MTIDRNIIWQETKDYFNITLGLMLYTFGFTVFLLPYEIVTGGIAGIGAIISMPQDFPSSGHSLSSMPCLLWRH